MRFAKIIQGNRNKVGSVGGNLNNTSNAGPSNLNGNNSTTNRNWNIGGHGGYYFEFLFPLPLGKKYKYVSIGLVGGRTLGGK